MIYNKKCIEKIENDICYPKRFVEWVDFFYSVKAIVKREKRPIKCLIYKNEVVIDSDTEYENIYDYTIIQ